MEKNKLKRPHAAQAVENDRKDGDLPSSTEPLIFYLFFYWMLFGQLVLLLLCLFGYESLRPIIDWISSIVPSVESLRHSEKVMNNDLARAHHALMWLFSPILIIAALFSPVQQGESRLFLKAASPFKKVFIIFLFLLLAIYAYSMFPDIVRQTLGLEQFAIGFALVSSFSSSFIALPFRCIKVILTDQGEEL